MQEEDQPPSLLRRRSQLPPLAPRQSQSVSRDQPSGSGSGRPPRLSHRSRAGCWTCRARKVKCDEVHPVCGPCARLNRECDWDHRWNVSASCSPTCDATNSTKVKYSNVKTTGNTVWDPEAAQSRTSNPITGQDNLPAFDVLTTDEDRERKAETHRPGTFGVVVTPESFAELPEYAASTSSAGSRRLSVHSHASSFAGKTPSPSRLLTRTRTDPNVVVLDRFEDASPTSALSLSLPSPARRQSLPNGLQYLAITSPPTGSTIIPTFTISPIVKSENNWMSHFRHYVVRRLVLPELERAHNDMLSPGSTKDAFEIEAAHFEPLSHAICAVSALNLTYNSSSTLEEAMQHYHQALSTQTTTSNPEELLSGGAFLRHFLLLIYDICIPMSDDAIGPNMWTIHLSHLQRIATMRHDRFGYEPHAYIIWYICELDMYACLLGSGNCDFIRSMLEQNILPPLDQQVPYVAPLLSGASPGDEIPGYHDILALNQAIVIQTAKLAQIAQTFRREAAESEIVAPGTAARWQATVMQLQSEMITLWTQAFPHYLHAGDPRAGEKLPSRVRYVFEHAYVLYHSAIIYSRTSMFPGQRRIPVANQLNIHADTEQRVLAILSVATSQLEQGQLDRRHIVFPLFMAGFATTQPDVKIQALDIMKTYEGSGIGQNTYRTRQLLAAVYEEQRRRADEGGRMEDVDWLTIARERSLMALNCGL